MPPEPLAQPEFVATPERFEALVGTLTAADALAVDTESNSMFAYRERVCLIQISTPAIDAIVDPLALDDISALAPVFANPAQEKVLHAAENDIVCLNRDFGFSFSGVFDTMTAARTLGWPQVGLASILEAQFGVTLDKKHQRADWGRRPLTPEMLDYARLDTHYLLALRERLDAALVEAGAREEAQEEFVRLTRLRAEPASDTPDGMAFWRVKGAFDLPAQRAAVLRALYAWREAQAARIDRPPFKVMSEASLLSLARHAPARMEEAQRVGGLSPLQVQRHGRAILQAIRQGLQDPPPPRPVMVRDPDHISERYDKLHTWRKDRARKRGVESDVIVPRSVLRDLAANPPRTLADLESIADLGPWRRRTYGEELVALLSPGLADRPS